jgi:hypothetical protein
MLFHPVKNQSCVLDFWDGVPLPPAAPGAQDKLEGVDSERLAVLARRIGLLRPQA